MTVEHVGFYLTIMIKAIIASILNIVLCYLLFTYLYNKGIEINLLLVIIILIAITIQTLIIKYIL